VKDQRSWLRRILKPFVPHAIQPTQIYLRQLRRESKNRVVLGPFKGMRYVEDAVGSTVQPKLLGIYERELWETVEKACKIDFDTIIDIGAAEGYYCIGLALRIPKAHNIAFEMESAGQQLIKQMASLNDVASRVDIRGRCEIDDLKAALPQGGRCLVICDVEGYEEVLMDPAKLPALRSTHLLVELHDLFVPNVTETIRGRFSATHDINVIHTADRSTDEFPYKSLFRTLTPKSWLIPMVFEYRQAPMKWFWMTPRTAMLPD